MKNMSLKKKKIVKGLRKSGSIYKHHGRKELGVGETSQISERRHTDFSCTKVTFGSTQSIKWEIHNGLSVTKCNGSRY